MPLTELKRVDVGAIGLWHITEDEDQLIELAGDEHCPEDIISPLKKLEWLTGRILIRHLTEFEGLKYEGIRKDEFGKPFLKNHTHHISLSHSYPYVAAQIHPTHSVGIDVEQPKEKLLKIAHRILDADEVKNAGDDITKHCIYWCAKEALYKVYGKRGLLFTNHLKVKPFVREAQGDIQGIIAWNGLKESIDLHYIVNRDFVMVYSKSN